MTETLSANENEDKLFYGVDEHDHYMRDYLEKVARQFEDQDIYGPTIFRGFADIMMKMLPGDPYARLPDKPTLHIDLRLLDSLQKRINLNIGYYEKGLARAMRVRESKVRIPVQASEGDGLPAAAQFPLPSPGMPISVSRMGREGRHGILEWRKPANENRDAQGYVATANEEYVHRYLQEVSLLFLVDQKLRLPRVFEAFSDRMFRLLPGNPYKASPIEMGLRSDFRLLRTLKTRVDSLIEQYERALGPSAR